ncbi:hypothetical protein [Marivita sp.]|uniref:hypothetical protein n=1 Tax=Marivita sp. TaxID=2003365 RepID=UPI002633F78D|nr:hypothetical protein [Marivita sp.]
MDQKEAQKYPAHRKDRINVRGLFGGMTTLESSSFIHRFLEIARTEKGKTGEPESERF